MDEPGPSTQRYNHAQLRRINAEAPPFAPYIHNVVDTSSSHSQISLSSTASIPSAGSTTRTGHQYSLTNGNGKTNDKPWLLLMMTSRSPKSDFLPMFIGKDNIAGRVELELTKPENIREVIVTLKGETTHLTEEPHTFLQISRTLIKQPSGKLTGNHSHAFSFVLPDDVTIVESNWSMVYPVPPKFHEKGILYIDYKIEVTVRRGLFSVDNTLMTNIVYLPETIAERPSPLREQVYLDRHPMPSPVLDPSGWKLLPPVEAVGSLVKNATVTAQLAIANPLSFALGTPIPLFLDLRNDDGARVVLDSIDVRIVRTLITRSVTGGERKLDVARAVFWPAQGSSLRRIKLWGEVIASKRLIPSFDFSKCSIKYSIVLYPRSSPETMKSRPLLEEEILVTLRNAPGVLPISLAPVGADAAPIERQRSMSSRLFPVDHGLVIT